jgi:PA domain
MIAKVSPMLSKVAAHGAGVALSFAAMVASAATFQITSLDPPNVGFNDPTPTQPVGGNTGTTLGEQRQIAFAKTLEIWGSKLRSDVPIRVITGFGALPCSSTGAALAGALPWNLLANFPNAARPNTAYPAALANKLAGSALLDDPNPLESADIFIVFNLNLGKQGCLDDSPFYLGVDNKVPPGLVNFVVVALHEMGHGLGFTTPTDEATGQQVVFSPDAPQGFPGIWDHYLYDNTQRKFWAEMSNEQRVNSAITPLNLAWAGPNVSRNAGRVLDRGVPDLFITGRDLTRLVPIGSAAFGPPVDRTSTLAAPMAGVSGLACTPLDAASAAAVRGKVAVIDRGECAFVVKVKNAQVAGAVAVIIADNMALLPAGSPPPPLVGVDASIIIPSVRVTLEDGAAIKAALARAKPPFQTSFAVLFENVFRLVGADRANRVLMFTPNPLELGSSVSHYDRSARRNLLMEPNINDDLTLSVSAPQDLTLQLLNDIGW